MAIPSSDLKLWELLQASSRCMMLIFLKDGLAAAWRPPFPLRERCPHPLDPRSGELI